MSFSAEQKQEIINHTYKSSCCRRALLSGVIFARGENVDGRVVITLEKTEYAEFVAKLVHEFYGKDAEIFRSPKGGRSIMLGFSSPAAVKYVAKIEETSDIDSFSVCEIGRAHV